MRDVSEHGEKIRRWLVYAQNQKINRGYQRPPPDWLFQKIGLRVSPIVFWPFYRAALVMGVYFGVVWGGLMYAFVWRTQNRAVMDVLLPCVIAGAGFGLIMAWNYQRARRRYGLPAWREFAG